ncbi:MAG TPA: dihydrofolate reductase [Candidatus Paceibacterota bacterium]|nr:dihydrofolate reductase [Candidatus Paceibacterota bacterium]
MRISIIAAMDESRAIGFQGKIPWHLSADFKKFRERTMGHPIIEGRKTFESIGRALPGRTNIVISRDPDYRAEGCVVVGSLDEALAVAARSEGGEEAFICGGGQIYALALPKADTLYLTRVKGTFGGDAFFPELSDTDWQLAGSEPHPKDEKNDADLEWLTYERR